MYIYIYIQHRHFESQYVSVKHDDVSKTGMHGSASERSPRPACRKRT